MVPRRLRASLIVSWILLTPTGLGARTLVAPPPFDACLDYHCDDSRRVALDADAWAPVRHLFAHVVDAPGERRAIAAAIARLETTIGRVTGTWRDLAGNRAGAGEPGQLDCIAESMNTTTYLRLLANDGLLRHHRVEPREKRTSWLVSVHWTAVIRDLSSGTRYAVDSWYRDNGQPPHILALDAWRSARGLKVER
jgi:hypothetical protein